MPCITPPGADAPLRLGSLPGANPPAIAVAQTLNPPTLIGNQAAQHAIVPQMSNPRDWDAFTLIG